MAKYDVLLVGAGLFNAVLATQFVEKGKKVLVVDRRGTIGGNCTTVCDEGIEIHKYGAHIFHTDNYSVWAFAKMYDDFMPFVNSPIAAYRENSGSIPKIFNLPFNMNTFVRVWPGKCVDPYSAKRIIEEQAQKYQKDSYANLEEKALSLVGEEIYELLIKHYTEKQWGCKCTELGPEIISRIPLRFTFDNNYFNDTWQGIPRHGYSKWIHNMLKGATVMLDTDYLSDRKTLDGMADHVFYSGMLDELFDYQHGCLPYRSLEFKTCRINRSNFQGVPVVNYTGPFPDCTRSIEHKHFMPWNKDAIEAEYTFVTNEYPRKFEKGGEAYYPVRNAESLAQWNAYLEMLPKNMTATGRLGRFEYNDMDDTIMKALALSKEWV